MKNYDFKGLIIVVLFVITLVFLGNSLYRDRISIKQEVEAIAKHGIPEAEFKEAIKVDTYFNELVKLCYESGNKKLTPGETYSKLDRLQEAFSQYAIHGKSTIIRDAANANSAFCQYAKEICLGKSSEAAEIQAEIATKCMAVLKTIYKIK
jgi:hypothetical protein